MRGDSSVPLESLVQFVRLSYSCDQREVVEVLADRLVQDTQVCVCVCVWGCVCGWMCGVWL